MALKKRSILIQKRVTLILKSTASIKKSPESKSTSIKTPNPHFLTQHHLKYSYDQDLDFALDLLKILLNEHFKSDTIALFT